MTNEERLQALKVARDGLRNMFRRWHGTHGVNATVDSHDVERAILALDNEIVARVFQKKDGK